MTGNKTGLRLKALQHKVLCIALSCLALIVFPALGAAFAGLPARNLLEFPPRTLFVAHAPFSAFWFISFLVFGGVVSFALFRGARKAAPGLVIAFPGYGYLAAACCLFSWFIAWSRLWPFQFIQHHTFFPLWLSWTMLASAFANRHEVRVFGGRPFKCLALFALSSLFWWYFEYLNRFVQNWSYENVSQFSPLEYFLFATLSFSTVLPAVAATNAVLRSFIGSWNAPVPREITSWLTKRISLSLIGIFSSLSLFLFPMFPNALFPLVWVAPTLLFLVTLEMCGRRSFLSQLASGDWTSVISWSLSGLICGILWEMWNFGSLARWVYHVPLVSGFYIFEMPLPGYAGYLPFGVLCGAVIEQVLRDVR